MKKRISHPLTADAPGWPGNPTCYIERRSSIPGGDSCNTSMVHFFNHFGTHFDAPRHYNQKGPSLCLLPFEDFFYHRPLLLDIPKGRGEKIEEADLTPHAQALAGCDLLMLRTGFQKMRGENPALYSAHGPAVSSGAARYLRDNFTANLKAVALDFVSLAAPTDTVDGDLAHQIMLGMFGPGYICIIEDVDLAGLPAQGIRGAVAIPLFFEDVDSGPVTMWAELDDPD